MASCFISLGKKLVTASYSWVDHILRDEWNNKKYLLNIWLRKDTSLKLYDEPYSTDTRMSGVLFTGKSGLAALWNSLLAQ